jgi:hypothetical protein
MFSMTAHPSDTDLEPTGRKAGMKAPGLQN